jgi:hypothetical protein
MASFEDDDVTNTPFRELKCCRKTIDAAADDDDPGTPR